MIHDTFNNNDFVIFYKKGAISVLDKYEIESSKDIGMATVFSPYVDGKKMSFTKNGQYFKDKETNSTWDIAGDCIKGQLEGKSLTKIPHGNHFAFAYLTFYPLTEIYKR